MTKRNSKGRREFKKQPMKKRNHGGRKEKSRDAISDMAGDGMEKGGAGKERNDGIYILMRVVAVYKSLDPF